MNIKQDQYEAEFSNLRIKGIPLQPEYASRYDRLLCGGIWCIVQLDYEFIEEEKKMSPIQMPHIDLDEVKQGRSAFTKEEWIAVLLGSTGMESDKFTERQR